MTPREKAHELFDKISKVETFSNAILITRHEARQAALIAVDEILKAVFEHQNAYDYWQEVKKEIINI